MIEHPILYTGQNVRRILAGEKTQTRRVVRTDDAPITSGRNVDLERRRGTARGIPTNAQNVRMCGLYLKADAPPGSTTVSARVFCPFGEPGHTLWVKETWRSSQGAALKSAAEIKDGRWPIWYRADGAVWFPAAQTGGPAFTTPQVHWRPSIFMSRWASRITLPVLSVRVERLQSISAEDARAEGLTRGDVNDHGGPVPAFRELWNSINGKRPGASWAANPWVWCVTHGEPEVRV